MVYFIGCSSLLEPPKIPENVTNMAQSFVYCSNLRYLPDIPEKVSNLRGTFGYCKLVTIAPTIPESVVDMTRTFVGCENLQIGPKIIPKNVELLEETFLECSNLSGKIRIEANPSIYTKCFYKCSTNTTNNLVLQGNTEVINNLLSTKSSDSKIIFE